MIASAKQLREWDAFTIKQEAINSLSLMERASRRWLEAARPLLRNTRIQVVAGFGNNGGDALAIARMLHQERFNVLVTLCNFGKELSSDAQCNWERLPKELEVRTLEREEDLSLLTFKTTDLIIDGMFGSGLRSAVTGPLASVIHSINASDATVLSIDIPSGLLSDSFTDHQAAIVRATAVITFHTMKLSFLFPECAAFVGFCKVLDIGLHKDFTRQSSFENLLLDHVRVSVLMVDRATFSHKGTYGHALVMAGNKATIGACILAAKAAMRSGAGLTTLLSDLEGINLQYPELMVSPLKGLQDWEQKTLCIGPGLGTDERATEKLRDALLQNRNPLVVDADALNIISQAPELLELVPKNSIFTPHPKELERLVGVSGNSFVQLEKARAFAKKHGIILLIKRAYTVVIDNDGCAYFNTTGNSGLAKGGSGDVLAGIICALLAQGYSSLSSALIGVYVHGMAADLSAAKHSKVSMTPLSVIATLPEAFDQLGV